MAAQAALYGGMAALEIAGGYFASQNIKDTARLNQDISNMNAKYAELDAFDARAEGFTEQARYQGVIDNTMKQGEANLAAADVDVNYGTQKGLQEQNQYIGQLNLMEIQKHAEEKALGYQTQANQYRMTGVLQRSQAEVTAATTMFNSEMGAVKTGITGYERGAFDVPRNTKIPGYRKPASEDLDF